MNRLSSFCRLSFQELESDVSSSANSCMDPFPDITIIDSYRERIDSGPSGSKEGKLDSDTDMSTTVTHIIVLIHGWMGTPAEMGYIRESMQNAATKHEPEEASTIRHKFVIHSATCNDDRTDDGIAVGGSRVAEEINSLVKYTVEDSQADQEEGSKLTTKNKFTLSIVGNSLGGLYGRHALAEIDWEVGGSTNLIPMCFVTTATPHLGISQHTYVPLPRAAEFFVAQGMKETGRDFFSFTPVIKDLFQKNDFMDPLSKFHERVAYINVYGTDFQVPTATAAFWAPESDSIHYRIPTTTQESTTMSTEQESIGSNVSEDPVENEPKIFIPSVTPKAIVMILKTPQRLDESNEEEAEDTKVITEEADETANEEKSSKEKRNSAQQFTSWSKQLDGLGWTKVLVDVREEVPEIPVPIGSDDESDANEQDENEFSGELGSDENNFDPNDTESTTGHNEDAEKESEIERANKDTWTAGELLKEFKGGLLIANKKRRSSLWGLKPRMPLGHTVMIANAKDDFNKKITTGGKPVMDYLSSSMIRTLTSRSTE